MALRQVLPIDAYGEGGFRIAETRYDGHVIVRPGHVERWEIASANPKDLTVRDLKPLLEDSLVPDIVVLGVGQAMRHPSPDIRKAFRQAGIGLEVLDTPSACRVYNMIAADARVVAAALIAI